MLYNFQFEKFHKTHLFEKKLSKNDYKKLIKYLQLVIA